MTIELDNYKTFGYKTNKTGLTLGTSYEFLDDLYLGVGSANFYEEIQTNSTASKRQQAQEEITGFFYKDEFWLW